MIRIGLTEIALFLTPFLLYAVFLYATRTGVTDVKAWPAPRVAWLAMAALALVIASLVLFAQFSGVPIGSTYVPAHVDEQGVFVPGKWR